ncbi:MAG: hypothetical protein R3F38_20015 [Gammaproteobacteria bacterium]
MARMRALETGKYLVRGTNTGITAIIDHKGNVTARIPLVSGRALRGVMYGTQGTTPLVQLGYWPVLGLATLLLIIGLLLARRPERPVVVRPLYHS